MKSILAKLSLIPAIVFSYTRLILPLFLFGQLKYQGRYGLSLIFYVTPKSWLSRTEFWQSWGGTTGYGYILLKKKTGSVRGDTKLLAHELTHADQIERLGIMFLPAYFIECARIKLFHKELNPYRDNKYEVEARKGAKQSVKACCSRSK